jgi:hypothetical protein
VEELREALQVAMSTEEMAPVRKVGQCARVVSIAETSNEVPGK